MGCQRSVRKCSTQFLFAETDVYRVCRPKVVRTCTQITLGNKIHQLQQHIRHPLSQFADARMDVAILVFLNTRNVHISSKFRSLHLDAHLIQNTWPTNNLNWTLWRWKTCKMFIHFRIQGQKTWFTSTCRFFDCAHVGWKSERTYRLYLLASKPTEKQVKSVFYYHFQLSTIPSHCPQSEPDSFIRVGYILCVIMKNDISRSHEILLNVM